MRAPFLVLTRRWLHRKLVSKQALSLERCWDCWAAGAWCLPRALCLCWVHLPHLSRICFFLGTLSSPGLHAPDAAGG